MFLMEVFSLSENQDCSLQNILYEEWGYMAGKFKRKSFAEIDLEDHFFDSLKRDYPGTNNSTGFKG